MSGTNLPALWRGRIDGEGPANEVWPAAAPEPKSLPDKLQWPGPLWYPCPISAADDKDGPGESQGPRIRSEDLALDAPTAQIAAGGTVAGMRGDDRQCLSPDLLVAYHEGRLDAHRRASLEQHLSGCPECSSRVESLAHPGADLEYTLALNGPKPDRQGADEPTVAVTGRRRDPVVLPQGATVASGEPKGAAAPGREEGRTPEPGSRLGPYLLLGPLGAGGMGVVYEAFDEERNARVALKILPRTDARTLYLFKREFRALADLFHPNLVTLYEFGCEAGHWFFTMERLDGVDFLAYVRPRTPGARDGPASANQLASTVRDDPSSPEPAPTEPVSLPSNPPEQLPSTRQAQGEDLEDTEREPVQAGPGVVGGRSPRVLDVERLRPAVRQLAEGVEALHGAGKLHRDLKPSNVMVTRQGRVVLLDFGLIAELAAPSFVDAPAAEADESPSHYGSGSSAGEVAGTLSYMAPEQALGEPLTEAADWYAVGVMLYESLTGRRPFVGSSLTQIREKLSNDPTPPRQLNPAAPADLDALCTDLLRRRPEERPTGPEVLRRLGTSPAASPPRGDRAPALRRAPFVGREQEMAVLEDAYRAVKSGRDVTMLAHGVSGAGKSALFQRFVEMRPAADAAVVLAGRCYEQESVPYKALDSLVDALARHLRRLSPEEAAALMPRDAAALARVFPVFNFVAAASGEKTALDAQELRRRAFAALRALLARIAARRPLILAIDDLQWGDVDSALLLVDLLRPPDPPPLLLLVAYRSEYATTSPCLRTLLGAWSDRNDGADRRELIVEPMRAAESAELALRLLGRDDAEARALAETAARESGGNPYFVLELVEQAAAAADVGGLARSSGQIDFDEILWRRIERLPEGSRRLLEAIAVAGRPLTLRCASRAADDDGTAARADAALRSGNLIRGAGPRLDDEVETYHDRIRETVVAHLGPEALRDWHGRLATALEEAGQADVETLAVHLEGAGDPGRAGGYFARAADQAAEALAFERAAGLYRRSITLRPPAGAEARAIRRKLADALANAGRGPEAAGQYLAASEGAERRESIDLQRKAAFQYYMSGHLDEGQAVLRGVLGRVGMALPRTRLGALASLLVHRLRLRLRGLGYRERRARDVPEALLAKIDVSWSVAAGLATKDPIIAPAFQSRNLLLALRAGEPLRLVRALAWEAAHDANGGIATRDRTLALHEAAKEVAQRCDEPYVRGFIELSGSVLAFHAHRWKVGAERGERAATIFREQCTGAAWELGQANTFLLWCMSWMGEYAAMSRRAALILEEAEKKGDLFTGANLGGYIQPLGLLARGEADEPLRLIARNVSPWSRTFYHVQHFTSLMASTPVHLYRGEPAVAYREQLAHEPAIRGNLILHVQLCRIVAAEMRARAALALAGTSPAADRRRLLGDVERQARRLEREAVPLALAFAGLVRAGLAAFRGSPDAAIAGLGSVATAFDSLDMGHYAAAARWRLGELVAGDEGRSIVENARAWMDGREIKEPARMADALVPQMAV